jgi:hypothetical protein
MSPCSVTLMIQRRCPCCGSELVRARNVDQESVPGIAAGVSAAWRCSVCGGGFTMKEIREGNRVRSSVEQA